MKRLIWPVLAAVILLWFLPAGAASVGKISGRVIDAASKAPIPSVNIQVIGTSTGASSNLDGEFFILNLPVGRYSLRVTSVGYETQVIEGVVILADQTYELEIRMKETVLTGQEVTVVAERDVVKRDVSATVRSVTSNEIEALPVTTYRDALARTAGAVGSNENIHIRGGRSDEILYLIDGMVVKDPQFQTRSLDVSQGAIGEMQVLTAGFNAEFGEAQSAVVNLVIKEGDPQYRGRIEHKMDFEGDARYQDYDYSEASISGPEPITGKLLPKLGARVPGTVSFFGSGSTWSRNTNDNGNWPNTDRWIRHQVTNIFETDIRKNEAHANTAMKLTWTPQAKYKMTAGWNQAQRWINPYWYRLSRRFPYDFTPEEQAEGMTAYAARIAGSTIGPTQFSNDDDADGRTDEEAINGADDDGDGRVDEDPQFYYYNANNGARGTRVRDQLFYGTFNNNLSQRTFYTLRLSYFKAGRNLTTGNKGPYEYGVPSEPFIDMPDAAGLYNGTYDIGEPFTDTDGDGMYDLGNPGNRYPLARRFPIAGDGLAGNTGQLVPRWADFRTSTLSLKADATSQLNLQHMAKGGLEFNYYDVQAEDRGYTSWDRAGELYPDVYRFWPVSAAAYVQDKMEFKDIIVNAGLRLDYWRIGGNRIQTPLARELGDENYVDYVPPDKSGKAYVSPRLGIAYSVTDRDVFHFNYGYFYQRGQLDYYFTGVNQLQTGGTPVIGNPDLDPMKTIAYELGVRHQFGADFLLDVGTYYKDIKNWIQTASRNQLYFDLYGVRYVGGNPAIYYNADYASVRGFEFNLSKDYSSHVSGRATYTIAWATGKNSYDLGSDITRQNRIDPLRETPLAWDRRHQIVFNLGLNYPAKGKPFTMQWLQSGWTVNILSQMLSGLPYTPTSVTGEDIQGAEFSKNSPWTYQTDLNVARSIKGGKLTWLLLLEVRNVFDRKNVLGWDANRGTIDTYDGGNPGYVNDNAAPNDGRWPLRSGPNPDAWGERRLVRAGLAVEF